LKLYIHEASRGLFATAELSVSFLGMFHLLSRYSAKNIKPVNWNAKYNCNVRC